MFCNHCGASNGVEAVFCQKCGKEMAAIPSDAAAAEATGNMADSESTVDVATSASTDNAAPCPSSESLEPGIVTYYKEAIGPKNQDYYLQRFARFDSTGKVGIGWHWPAFFVTAYWFLYRKMWRNALIYSIVPGLLMLLGTLIFMAAGCSVNPWVINLVYLGFLLVVPPLYANTLYYKHCQVKIQEVKRSGHNPDWQLGALSAIGGTSRVVWYFLAFFVLSVLLGILAAIAVPAYQGYLVNAKVTPIVLYGKEAAQAVGNYYERTQRLPGTVGQAGFTKPQPPSVQDIEINSQNGIVRMTLSLPPLAGKAIVFIPSESGSGAISWTCKSPDIPATWLPQECR